MRNCVGLLGLVASLAGCASDGVAPAAARPRVDPAAVAARMQRADAQAAERRRSSVEGRAYLRTLPVFDAAVPARDRVDSTLAVLRAREQQRRAATADVRLF